MTTGNCPASEVQGAILAALAAPGAPRALLVSVNRRGQLTLDAIEQGQSVMNIETELMDHLNSRPHSDAWLIALRDYCDGRLAARKEASATGGISIPMPGGWNIAHIAAFESLPEVH